MNNIIALSILQLLFISCLSQPKVVSIIGKWQEIEYHGNDGANDYVQNIKNGKIFIFENNNIVKDELNNKGKYELKGDSLRIVLAKDVFHYRFYIDNNNLNLNPVTEKYEIICDEGCSYLFKRK